MTTTDEYMFLLKSLDDPVFWEWPPGFDLDAAERKFLSFASALQQQLTTICTIETGALIQDASFRGQIVLPDFLLQQLPQEYAVVIRVSNWGNIATVSDEQILQPSALTTIRDLMQQFGYVYIPSDLLNTPYTGKNPGVTGIRTWWIRYFDWV